MFARSKPSARPAIPFGHRIYAIGDVHGEGALLRRALQLIKEDSAARREATVTLIFLGDLIDRGPDAAALLETFARLAVDHVVVLKGNHEEALVQAYGGDDEVLDAWMPFGAMATLNGFGITLKEIDSTNTVFTAALRSRIDPDLIAWLDALPSAWECGDYYFTHAGIRPGVELDQQDDADLRWIREPFLSSRKNHGKVIVHGHTVEPGTPPLGGNRIGIDTGAHEHGVLTALGLEGERQWLLQATTGLERDAAAAVPAGANDSDDPSPDIPALIAAIVTPPEPPDDALVLRTVHEPKEDPLRPVRRRKWLGNKGVVAAGFSLVLASVGGVIAVRSTLPHGPGGVTMPFPEILGGSAAPAPIATPATAIDTPAKTSGERRRLRRPVTGPAADGDAPRLYGDALANALEADRAITRKLNEEELSRQRPHAPTE